MVTEQFGGLAGGFKSQLCRILAAKLEVIHCISLYLGFLRCNINITLVFSIKVSASSGGHRRGCQDRKGMRHESDVLGKTPVREVGEAWGAGRAFRPQCRCVPWAGEREGLFGKATGVSQSQSHCQRSPTSARGGPAQVMSSCHTHHQRGNRPRAQWSITPAQSEV